LPPVRTFASIGVILAALTGILGLSISSALQERERLVDEFTQVTRQQVHASVEALSARLDALDQDTRLLTDLVERSGEGADSDPALERRVWAAAFRALAVVVPQYRAIAMVGARGDIELQASDPGESAEAVEALAGPTRTLGQEVSARHARALGKPVRWGARSFLLYGTPVRGGRAIVVASDAATFLGAVAWTPTPAARLFVTDPAGVIWAGCETAAGCRATGRDTVDKDLVVDPPRVSQVTSRGARVVRSTRFPAVQVSERVDRPTGGWVVTWLASTQKIVEGQWTVVARVVWTALAAAMAVAAVGTVILRQQRKAVELQNRLRYAQELANARETSQSIVDNAPLGVLGVSRDGRVVLANGFLTDRAGPVLVGAPLGDAFPGPRPEWVGELQRLLLLPGPGAGAPAQQGELRSVAAGSNKFQVRVVPVRNHELGVRAFALVEDQSELRSLEGQLVRAEKLITVGVLSAGIAHEIGSPLAVIRGRAEQVLRVQTDGARAEDLRVIIKHIDNITSTIRQVLDFSRRQAIEQQAVALDAIVERTRALLAWKLEARGLELDVELEEGLPPVAADPDQLQQVLVNLVLNACDASHDGARVVLAARRGRPGLVRIEIVDHGCGIAPEHMNAVFDPFFTTKKRGEGTGLGLPIAASIVRNHGGDINLSSTPGQGTTVTVMWPVAVAGVAAAVRIHA
jgi:signal transduction histidine kinase